jgi:hypothetical protein
VRVLVRNKIWRLVYTTTLEEGTDGECDAPFIKKKQIRIRKELKGQRLLDAYVHEVTHAALWLLGEGPVASLANCVALDLWECGLRPGRKTTKVTRDRLEHHIVSVIWTRGEVAVIDEDVRREVAEAIARMLSNLGWAFK